MLEIPKVNSPQFKASQVQAAPMQQTAMISPSMDRDTFERMQAKKKEKNKEAWYKTGVVAQVGLAVAFGIMALTQLASHKSNKKAIEAQAKYFEQQVKNKKQIQDVIKNVFEDISKADGIKDMALSKDLEKVINDFKYSIENRETIIERGGETVNSILFYGPPGTGKTTVAKAIAKMFPDSKFASLDVTKMKDKYVGETEKNVNAIIDNICNEADSMYKKYEDELIKVIGSDIVKKGNEKEISEAIAKAKKEGKKIPEMNRIFVFADEIDSVMMVDNSSSAKFSNDVLNEFKKGFTEKLGKRKNIVALGATNLEIDAKKAMTKDGKQLDKPMLDRFDLHIFVGNPTKDQLKKATVKRYADKSLVADEIKNEDSKKLDIICDFLAQKEHGTSFRKLRAIFKTAGNTVKKGADGNTDAAAKINADDLLDAIRAMKESLNVTEAELEELSSALKNVA